MNGNGDAVVVLAHRLEALERSNARLRRALVVVLGVTVGVGFLAPRTAVIAREDSPNVECQKLTLKDSKGRVRGLFAIANDDTPILSMFDENGKVRANMTLDEKGAPNFGFCDDHQKPKLSMALVDDGPVIVLSGRHKEGTRVTLAATKTETGMTIDKDGKTKIALAHTNENLSLIVIKDAEEKARMVIGANSDGSAEMSLLDGEGKQLWKKP